MASLHGLALGHLHHDHDLDHDLDLHLHTDLTAPLHLDPPTSPPSPSILAAATTLATLADSSRPPAANHSEGEGEALDDDAQDDDDDDDHDYGGGISITDADLHDYASASSVADTHMTDQDIADQMHEVVAQMQSFQSFPHIEPSGSFDVFEQMSAYHLPSTLQFGTEQPLAPIISGFLSSSDYSLEPPPTLQEAHLSIQDNGSFLPISTFFHRIAPESPPVRGLDVIFPPDSITKDDLRGDSFDFQGIDWAERNTTRSHVRAKRYEFEHAKLQRRLQQCPKDLHKPEEVHQLHNTDQGFQFKRNNTQHRAFFPHFQLRNVLTATSRNDIFYAAGHCVYRTDAEGTPQDKVIDLSKRLALEGSITTIASTENVLIAGAFDGEYAITDLSSTYGSPCTFGRTSDYTLDTKSRIVNNMHLFHSRSTNQPQAVFCSNDHHLRVLDCATGTFTHSFLYPAAVNCSATSPDGRMRIVVGDFQEALVVNAQTGQPFEILHWHKDDVFACAWADNGIHVATAAQDSTIAIYDARCWRSPLEHFARPPHRLASSLSVPRSLHFSPIGSGPRVLVAAEADDYINIINAQTFASSQVFDFFGPIGGAAFTPDGQSLFVANGERRFGGIVEVERNFWGGEEGDWASDDGLDVSGRVVCGGVERERRGVGVGGVVV